MMQEAGFIDITIGDPVDTFAEAGGAEKAAQFDVHGYSFLARRPSP